jgi:hypothetical protein
MAQHAPVRSRGRSERHLRRWFQRPLEATTRDRPQSDRPPGRRSTIVSTYGPPPSVAKYFRLSTGEPGQLTILFNTGFSANSLGLALLPLEEATALVVRVDYQDKGRTVEQAILTLVDSSPMTLLTVCNLIGERMAPWDYFEQLPAGPLPLPPPTPPSR